MAISTPALGQPARAIDEPQLRLGGLAALAESSWMGSVQATEVLETVRTMPAARGWAVRFPRPARLPLAGLLTREFSAAEASLILMVSFFLSAALGAVRQVLFNAQFGVGPEASAYYAAFRLPDTLFSLIAGGALSSAMIPILLGAVQHEGPQAGARFVNLVLSFLLAVFALIVLAGEMFAPAFVGSLLAPGFDAPTQQLTVTLTRIMLAQPLILAVATVATALLNSRNQFFLTAISVVSHNVALIVGILATRAYPALGIYGPTLGVVLGAVLQVLILLPGLLQQGIRLQPAWGLADRNLRALLRLLVPNGLSVSVNYAGFIVDTAFASRVQSEAALPAIFNAWLLVGLPIALLGQAVGQGTFPRLAAHAAAGDWAAMRRTLVRTLGVAVALAGPALIALVLLGRPTIALLFERGRFTAAAGDLTYQVLLAYAVALPAFVATEVITRGLIALRDTQTPLLTNILQMAGRVAFLALLVGQLGAVAIPLALAITATAETLILATVLFVKLRRVQSAPPAAGGV